MRNIKVVILGAGSTIFAKKVIADMLSFKALRETTFALVDINKERLEIARQMTEQVNKTFNAAAKVETYGATQRNKALAGADFVINMVDLGGLPATLIDFKIPKKYGLRQTIADTLGIGGIFRGLRTFPYLFQLCADIHKLCPEALLINYVNPMAMICLAIFRTAGIKAVGICHGTQWTHRTLRFYSSLVQLSAKERHRVLSDLKERYEWWENGRGAGIPLEEFTSWGGGINHMNFRLKCEHKGKDMYPLIRKAAQIPEIWRLDPVRFELLKLLGYFCTETSFHTAEYLPYFIKSPSEVKRLDITLDLYIKFKKANERKAQELGRQIARKESIIQLPHERSPEYAPEIIHAMVTNIPFKFNGNVYNKNGLISNLQTDACVEVPCLVDGSGIQPLPIGNLPPQCAALIRTNINVQDLAVRAGIEPKREYLYQAAMADPNTSSMLTLDQIVALCDDMCRAHRKWIHPGLARGL